MTALDRSGRHVDGNRQSQEPRSRRAFGQPGQLGQLLPLFYGEEGKERRTIGTVTLLRVPGSASERKGQGTVQTVQSSDVSAKPRCGASED